MTAEKEVMADSEQEIRVYLDQNVLDFIVKGHLDDLKADLQGSRYRVVYSPATIEELSRIAKREDRQKFFDCLIDLDAHYFWVDNNELARFEYRDPEDLYTQHLHNDSMFGPVQHSMEQVHFKMLGGRQDDDFSSLLSDQMKSMNDLFATLTSDLDEDFFSPFEQRVLRIKIEDMRHQLKQNLGEMDQLFSENIPDQVGYDAISDFRKLTEVGPLQLNNIDPPNVIPKIWEVVKQTEPFSDNEWDFESLYGQGLWEKWPQGKVTLMQKVNSLYNILNTLGYYSDPKLSKERRFTATLSDHQHAGYGAYAHILISRDERFVKKTEAVYEYLEIGTQIEWPKTEQNR